jgi:hypothetical protein
MSDSTSGTSNIYRIKPLEGAENYAVWKIKMVDILTDQGLWEYVEGTAPDAEEQLAAWKKKDRTALSTIRLRVADKLLVYIASATSAKQAWTTLKELLEAQGPLGIVLARRKLFRARCEEGTSVEEHIRTLRSYQEELHSLGEEINDSEFSIILLTSLPDSWNNYISSIDTTTLTNAPKLIARILEHDRRMQIQNHDDTALTARNGKKKFNPNITCYGCGKRGHVLPDCRSGDKTGNLKRDRFNRKGSNTTRAHEATDDFAFSGTDMALTSLSSESWLADSACTSHISRRRDVFVTYIATPGHKITGFGNVDGLGRGTIKLESTVDGKTFPITLKDVVHAPDAPHNLISIGRATDANMHILFKGKMARFRAPGGTIFAEGTKHGQLFLMNVKGIAKQDQAFAAKHGRTWDDWHKIFGHLNMASIKMLHTKNMVDGMDINESIEPMAQCEPCIVAKQHVQPFPKESHTAISEIGDLTVSDLWGPTRTRAIGGEYYFGTFTDGKSRRTMTYFLKEKSEALAKFKQYKSFVETQTSHKLKKLRVDGGGEFINDQFKKYLLDSGIQLEITAAHSPSQNGIAERLNRTLVEHSRAMLHAHKLPYFLWTEAVAYATYLKNRSPTRAIKDAKTPDEVFWGTKPNVANLQEFGRKCWVLQQDGKQSKLDPKSRQYIFTGISTSTKGYRYYNPATRKILTSRNVIFSVDTPSEDPDDDDTPSRPTLIEGENVGTINQTSGLVEIPDNPPEQIPDSPIPKGKPSKIPITSREKSSRIMSQPIINYRVLNNPAARGPQEWQHHVPVTDDTTQLANDIAMVANLSQDDPLSLEEAKNRTDWPHWKKAMDDEIQQLETLGTYAKTELPNDRVPIACKWVYRLKRDHTGKIMRYKARLVAKGFSQIPGLDFSETFAPVMRLDTLRLLLALAAMYGMVIHIVDIVGAYLNGDLDEIIYMKQPPGYEDGTHLVCKLIKSLYGLRQSGRVWNQKLNDAFQKLGFTRLFADQCVYFRRIDHDLAIVAVHVDDMAVIASDDDAASKLKHELKKIFTITDLGEAKQIVGLEVTRNSEEGTIKIAQSQYIKKILDRFGMSNSHPVSMPLDPNIKLTKTPDNEHHDIPEYGAAIGSLMYAAIGTRPDIAFTVQTLSQFMSNPNPSHWTAVKRVFRYLNGTQDLGIIYRSGGDLKPHGYSDADWGSNINDRKSISGNVFLMADGPISWSSKKQPTIALSSMEAEYMAESLATRHAIWLRTLFTELGLPYSEPTNLKVDNQAAIDYSKNSGHHSRSKHIDIQHHFVREKIISNEITVQYCASEDNLADIFTKALPKPKHQELIARLGMTSELRGSVEWQPG